MFKRFAFIVLSLYLVTSLKAQTTVIHYWHYNSFSQTYHNPDIPQIAADYSAIDTSAAKMVYYLIPGTSSKYAGFIEPFAGDATNARLGFAAGNAFRLRNPSDSMELRFYIPTTNFRNIKFSFALNASQPANAQLAQHYDYSTDSGATWRTGGLNMTIDSTNQPQYQGSSFGIVALNFGTDTTVNFNPRLVFRMKFTGNASKTQGNNRFDNVVVEGDYVSPATAINITKPAAGDTLVIGSHTTVSFTTTGNVAPARIVEFSADGLAPWTTLTLLNNTTTYDWLVPNTPSTHAYIRVTDANNVTDKSGAFVILGDTPAPKLTITAPVAGAQWKPRDHRTISWTEQGPVQEPITIDYSYDGGTNWNTLTTSGAQPSYDWSIPNTPSTQVTVRLKDVNGVTATSPVFQITKGDLGPAGANLLHYWSFNDLNGTYHGPNFPPMPTNFSRVDSINAAIRYVLKSGTSPSYPGYFDYVDGDTANAQMDFAAGQSLRVRNPADSAKLLIFAPTTGYNNIRIKYAVQNSRPDQGPLAHFYDYSTDGGATWRTDNLSKISTPISSIKAQAPNWLVANVSIDDPSVNSNPRFVFRITFAGNNTSTTGHNRFDNVTVEGDEILESVPQAKTISGEAYPNPATDHITVDIPSTPRATATLFSESGVKLMISTVEDSRITFSTVALANGTYYIRISSPGTADRTLKFVKW